MGVGSVESVKSVKSVGRLGRIERTGIGVMWGGLEPRDSRGGTHKPM